MKMDKTNTLKEISNSTLVGLLKQLEARADKSDARAKHFEAAFEQMTTFSTLFD